MIGGAKGIGIGIDFGIPNQYCRATSKPYIEKDVLDSLRVVSSAYGKSNNDADRSIVKNLVDPDNPFVISNAAYTEGSGYADKDSPYYGAFVTDGIDDLITSTKTVQEMLGGSTEFTAVSMIHLISPGQDVDGAAYTNYIRTSDNYWTSNRVSNVGKTGIYGYSFKQSTPTVINNILGDKGDYTTDKSPDTSEMFRANFSVEGFKHAISGTVHASSVAWYWTVIANKVLTTDEINQVIAYYNLDRTLRPDILCNITKQGITNDNHADFNDKLIDYSGNGRDIQMNNLAWKGGSGIAAKQYETFKDWTSESSSTSIITQIDEFTRIVESTTNGYWVSRIRRDSDLNKVYDAINVYLYQDNNSLVHECKYEVDGIKYSIPINESVGKGYHKLEMYTKDRYTELPENAENVVLSEWYFPKSTKGSIKYSIIPSCKGGILLDGINDFGKVTGMPVYKDFTVVTDREMFAHIGAISSKNNPGAFIETAGNSVYSFGQGTSGLNFISTRSISYLSKYSYCGQSITAGAAEDGTDMWLGTIRDNDSRFLNGTIYSLMSFPYSMSEFLIERQLKKHKLGTLYPDMVEFRPVIKSNVLLDAKPTFVIRGTSTYLNAGDYVPENSQIWVSIKMNNIADRITKFTVNGKTIDIPENAYSEVTLQYGFPFVIDKSPQKISITIEQDENYVKFEPVITSNVEYVRLDFYLNNYQKRINIGDYIPKDAYLRANLYLKNNVDELTVFTFNGVNIGYRRSSVDDTAFNISQIYNYDSPQEVNITIDEYIRYEDIVQPYPVLLRFNDENGNEVSWGDKIKVGSSITRIGSAADSNLLPNIYNIFGLLLNDNQVTSSKVIVEKTMVFKAKSAYIFDNNEPKVILSPSRLRIPNPSYKILGHIPDISGHGNHGVIHNSAYAGASGANGYPYDYNNSSFWCDSILAKVVSGELIEYFAVKNSTGFSNITSGVYKGEIKVTGVTKAISENKISRLRIYTNSTTDNELIDITQDGNYNIDIKGVGDANRVFFYAIPNNPNESIVVRLTEPIYIEQVGEYEGAYCLDGVDDFVAIPTVTGGKQVLMKVNWQSEVGAVTLYDQRLNLPDYEFAIYNGTRDLDDNPVIAYQGRNNGQTYIDGILNSNIMASELKAITHNITITNELSLGTNNTYPVIGSTRSNTHFAQMSLYDFMLFDNISTDDKIKELNEYVGIEAKVELPPYYWDAYGKTNLDADKATIQQRGVAVGDYDLINNNFAYEGMSGYNGYPVVFGASKTWANESNGYVSSITSNTIHITNVLNAGLALLYSYVKYNGNLQNIKEIPPFKIEIKGLEGRSKFIYKYLATSDATKETNLYLGNGTHELPKSFLPTEALVNDAVVGFSISPIEEGVTNFLSDITIEVLPEYENGLAYDGITDYSKNANIPVLTDYTYIYKRTIINIPINAATLLKGADKTSGGAFIADYGNKWQFNFGQYNIIQGIADGINWQTVNSFNGTSINKGENTDDSGITVAKFSNGYTSMVFYKLILYPKTISLLEINFLKNLMEKDEIIDLNNKIFIQ
jgi:hypothetical protein